MDENGTTLMSALNQEERFDVASCDREEAKQFELGVDVGAIFARPFRIYRFKQNRERARQVFPASLQGGKHLRAFRRVLNVALPLQRSGKFQSCIHRQTIATHDASGNAFCRRPSVFHPMRCDISAGLFVAKQSRHADATGNEEAAFSRMRFHAPKLCLGETHVPEIFSSKTRKNASRCSHNRLSPPLVDFFR